MLLTSTVTLLTHPGTQRLSLHSKRAGQAQPASSAPGWFKSPLLRDCRLPHATGVPQRQPSTLATSSRAAAWAPGFPQSGVSLGVQLTRLGGPQNSPPQTQTQVTLPQSKLGLMPSLQRYLPGTPCPQPRGSVQNIKNTSSHVETRTGQEAGRAGRLGFLCLRPEGEDGIPRGAGYLLLPSSRRERRGGVGSGLGCLAKAEAAKPGHLSLLSGTYIVEGQA